MSSITTEQFFQVYEPLDAPRTGVTTSDIINKFKEALQMNNSQRLNDQPVGDNMDTSDEHLVVNNIKDKMDKMEL